MSVPTSPRAIQQQASDALHLALVTAGGTATLPSLAVAMGLNPYMATARINSRWPQLTLYLTDFLDADQNTVFKLRGRGDELYPHLLAVYVILDIPLPTVPEKAVPTSPFAAAFADSRARCYRVIREAVLEGQHITVVCLRPHGHAGAPETCFPTRLASDGDGQPSAPDVAPRPAPTFDVTLDSLLRVLTRLDGRGRADDGSVERPAEAWLAFMPALDAWHRAGSPHLPGVRFVVVPETTSGFRVYDRARGIVTGCRDTGVNADAPMSSGSVHYDAVDEAGHDAGRLNAWTARQRGPS